MSNRPGFCFGNASDDSDRGWFVGQFVKEPDSPRRNDHIEIKWGVHPIDEQGHPDWVHYRSSTSISILIQGKCAISVRTVDNSREVLLENPGDYLMVEPGVAHTWRAVTACIVLTVRYPSVPGDQVPGLPPGF